MDNFVIIPRDEYDDLIAARFGIDIIGSSIGPYGANDSIVRAVCKRFGYGKETGDECEEA